MGCSRDGGDDSYMEEHCGGFCDDSINQSIKAIYTEPYVACKLEAISVRLRIVIILMF